MFLAKKTANQCGECKIDSFEVITGGRGAYPCLAETWPDKRPSTQLAKGLSKPFFRQALGPSKNKAVPTSRTEGCI